MRAKIDSLWASSEDTVVCRGIPSNSTTYTERSLGNNSTRRVTKITKAKMEITT